MKQILYVLVGVLAGFILAGALLIVARLPDGKAVSLQPAPPPSPLTVQVIGAVVRPGVYVFPGGGRVQDAVTAAGGLLSTADPSAVNLAAKLEDGEQVLIPTLANSGVNPSGPSTGPFTVIVTPTNTASNLSLIDINTATLSDLESLPGIGPTVAQKILDYRQLHGSFLRIADLLTLPGIGVSTFDNIKYLISVN